MLQPAGCSLELVAAPVIQQAAPPLDESFLVLHFDEKWFVNKYIKKYKQINVNKENLNSFIESLVKKTMINIVITTGNTNLDLLSWDKGFYRKDIGHKVID